MSGRWQLCAAFVVAVALVARLPPGPAPLPRPAKPDPDFALVVVEFLPQDEAGAYRARVQRISVRGNAVLPARTVWEGDECWVRSVWPHRLVADRYLVTGDCGVIDLHTGKIINDEQGGKFRYGDARQLRYCRVDTTRGSGDFSFHFATGELRRVGDAPKMWGSTHFLPSPDGVNMLATESGDSDIINLHRDDAEAKWLDGFVMEMKFDPRRSISYPTPVLWLDEGRFLAQRGNGRLVTVDLGGKVTPLVTIPDAGFGPTYLSRDRSGAILYLCGAGNFNIDPARGTATKTEWRGLGHGFEMSLEYDNALSYQFRHNGKPIGRFPCEWWLARSAPGYLAVPAHNARTPATLVQDLMVWSAATGEWMTVGKMRSGSDKVVGWVK